MKFEWDEKKNKQNINKHDLSFETAKEIFEDENRIDFPDDRKDYKEERRITIGKIFEVLHTVVYTLRKNVIRIISARRSKQKERKLYNFKNQENAGI